MRQNSFGLEQRWTKDLWSLLLTTTSGLSVADVHRCCRNYDFKKTPMEAIRRRSNEMKSFEIEHDFEIKITKFSDMLTKSLEENLRKQLAPIKK